MANRKALVLATGAVQEIGSADDLDFNNAKGVNVEDPVSAQDAATKNYFDTFSPLRKWVSTNVRVATTAAGTLASSFENGDTVDGVTLATGDRILIKDQASGAENGIYTVNASGAPTRATDFDASAEAVPGSFVFVTAGTANANTTWILLTAGPITLGTTPLVWVKRLTGNDLLAIRGDRATAGFHANIEAHTDEASPFRAVLGVVGDPTAGNRYAYLIALDGGAATRLRLQQFGGTVEYAAVPAGDTEVTNKLYVDNRTKVYRDIGDKGTGASTSELTANSTPLTGTERIDGSVIRAVGSFSFTGSAGQRSVRFNMGGGLLLHYFLATGQSFGPPMHFWFYWDVHILSSSNATWNILIYKDDGTQMGGGGGVSTANMKAASAGFNISVQTANAADEVTGHGLTTAVTV